MKKHETILILHNIRSTHNVGSIFRTAECAGVSKIILCGYTPTPIDRFKRERSDIAKVALGAEKIIPWEYFETTEEAVKKLKEENFKIIALEQSQKSVDYKKVKLSEHSALIVGNEVEGISGDILNMCDIVTEIPMMGEKESLNVSVALGIALFRIMGI